MNEPVAPTTPAPAVPTQTPAAELPVPAAMALFGNQVEEAARANGQPVGGAPRQEGPPGTITAMEIDPNSSEAVQQAERALAAQLGVEVVIKGQVPGAKPAAAPGAAKTDENMHPLRRMLMGDQAAEVAALPEPPQAVLDYFSQAGIENAGSLIKELPTIRMRAETSEAKVNELSGQLAQLENLSADFHDVLQAEIEGRPWQDDFRSGIDFEKPFSRQNERAIVEKFSKIKVSSEQWDEYKDPNGDPKDKAYVTAAIEDAKGTFDDRRQQRLDRGTQSKQRGQEIQSKFNTSKAKSLDVLNTIPGAAQHRDRIAKALTPEGFRSVFFQKDGVTLKPDAAFNMLLLLDRDTILGGFEQVTGTQARSAAERQQLTRKDERPAPGTRKGAPGGQTSEQLAYAEMRNLMGPGWTPGR